MKNLAINFTYPWLLLCAVALVGVVLFSYFRLAKKYRRTRNRIIAVVCNIVVMICATLLLAGFNVSYQLPNMDNEIILLVDISDTLDVSIEDRDKAVKNILRDAKYDNYKVGVVTFGFNQNYAVPLTNDVEGIYLKYTESLEGDLVDRSATDIASALNYTKTLFSKRSASKIVLVTDGKETDNNALSVIRSIVADSIKLNVAQISTERDSDEIQITDVEFPQYHVEIDNEETVTISVFSNVDTIASFVLYDNNEKDDKVVEKNLKKGENVVEFKHAFKNDGLHTIRIDATSVKDTLEMNNTFYSYYYLHSFNNVLIIENYNDTSLALSEVLSDENQFVTTIVNVNTAVSTYNNVDELRQYDQVILNNVSYDDMGGEFVELLNNYVYEFGGGLLTVAGTDVSDEIHLYSKEDLQGTKYQSMLPIQATNYTPPLGVVFIIDKSGSMSSAIAGFGSRLEWAVSCINKCLDGLTERDYVGVLTFDSMDTMVLPLTSCNDKEKIKESLYEVMEPTSSTDPEESIKSAIQMLAPFNSVEKKHIIMITDGQISNDKTYMADWIADAYESYGITFSIAALDSAAESYRTNLQLYTDAGHGRYIPLDDYSNILDKFSEELKVPEILEKSDEPFYLKVNNKNSSLSKALTGGLDFSEIQIGGFCGVKAKSTADVVLVGDYDVPIYAQWKYGLGSIGSFMIDLNANWSDEFMQDYNGRQFIKNAVSNLMPIDNIKPIEMQYTFKEGNYYNNLSIYENLKDDEYINGTITYINEGGQNVEVSLNEITSTNDVNDDVNLIVTSALSKENNYSRSTFIVKRGGVYAIKLEKFTNSSDTPIATVNVYKEFSYSQEYNIKFDDEDKTSDNLNSLAIRGNGKIIENIEDPVEVFTGFITEINKIYDPRTILAIIIIVFFLTGIAVRKFKFKWIHEIIREKKEKVNLK